MGAYIATKGVAIPLRGTPPALPYRGVICLDLLQQFALDRLATLAQPTEIKYPSFTEVPAK
jgi:hypothetical protein